MAELRDLAVGDQITVDGDDYIVANVQVVSFATSSATDTYQATILPRGSSEANDAATLDGSGVSVVDRTALNTKDAALLRECELFTDAVSVAQVNRSLAWFPRNNAATDHWQLAGLCMDSDEVESAKDEVEAARASAFVASFGPYGKFSALRPGASWDNDPTLTRRRETSSAADVAWDRLTGKHRSMELLARRLIRSEQPGTLTLQRIGEMFHRELHYPDPSRFLQEDERKLMVDAALRYGPYGTLRSYLPPA